MRAGAMANTIPMIKPITVRPIETPPGAGSGLKPPSLGLGQGDALKGADDIVRTFGREKALVVARTEIPVIALVIFVAIKTPDTVHHDDGTDAVIPKFADEMEAQVRPGVGAAKTNVIVNDQLGQLDNVFVEHDLFFAHS